MPDHEFSDEELLAYFDESLSVEQMANLERCLRTSSELRDRAGELTIRRNQGAHSVGEVWRRHRLSCPPRSQLGSYLLGALDAEAENYIRFHLDVIGCRICTANLEDLQSKSAASEETTTRRQKFFQSSAGYLPPGEP